MAALVGGPRQAARLEVIRATEDTGWFQAPRNVAFTMIGWLYGDGDFGKSICTAVNCGDDTDCTGATLGAILGIIGGTKTIPAKRRDPIGEKNVTVAVAGFPGPKDLNKLTDRTLAMTKKVLAMNNAPIAITGGFSHKSGAKALLDSAPAAVRPLWNKSPYQIVWHEPDLQVTLDYLTDPVIQPKVQRSLQVTVHNQGDAAKSVRVELKDVPKGWQVTGLPSEAISLAGHAAKTLDWALAASQVAPGANRLGLSVTGAAQPVVIPLTLMGPNPGNPAK